MNYLRITKTFTFEMAHQLLNYEGQCKNIHGHSYTLYVTIGGKVISNLLDPKDGMVMDFSELKRIVNEQIVHPYDHALVLNCLTPVDHILALESVTEKVILTPFQPTCENLTLYFASALSANLPSSVKLLKLKLCETATSHCEWLYEDNLSES
jgi:6-pyruvoyltetrahydropterin/6-carboxytetrahydropterin synthase